MSFAIQELFNLSRFNGGTNFVIFLLYIPFGLIIFSLRIFFLLQLCLASLILPAKTNLRKFALRILYMVIGIVVREENSHKKDKTCRIIILNHITPFDHLAVSLVDPCISIGIYNLPSPLSTILAYVDFGISKGKVAMKSNIETYLKQPESFPILLHPEGGTTNGVTSLMKYGSWAFEIEDSVLAVGLKVDRFSLLPISPTVLGGSWAADVFYLLFSPFTFFKISYIGKLSRGSSESYEDFALKVQKITAATLGIEASNFSVADKVEYMDACLKKESSLPDPALSPEIHRLALQVREVLPYLTMDLIKRNLVQTRNVDMTITNFLEGNIPEAAELQNSQSDTSTVRDSALSGMVSPNSGSSIEQHIAAKASSSFPTSAFDRMDYFQKRKAILIENCRKKYLEIHNNKVDSGVKC